MTDSDKLDLLLEKITKLEKDVTDVKADVANVKADVANVKADVANIKADLKRLHRNDELILDEVERVHILFEKHRTDQSVHTA